MNGTKATHPCNSDGLCLLCNKQLEAALPDGMGNTKYWSPQMTMGVLEIMNIKQT